MDIKNRIEGDVFFTTDTVVDWVDLFTRLAIGYGMMTLQTNKLRLKLSFTERQKELYRKVIQE